MPARLLAPEISIGVRGSGGTGGTGGTAAGKAIGVCASAIGVCAVGGVDGSAEAYGLLTVMCTPIQVPQAGFGHLNMVHNARCRKAR